MKKNMNWFPKYQENQGDENPIFCGVLRGYVVKIIKKLDHNQKLRLTDVFKFMVKNK